MSSAAVAVAPITTSTTRGPQHYRLSTIITQTHNAALSPTGSHNCRQQELLLRAKHKAQPRHAKCSPKGDTGVGTEASSSLTSFKTNRNESAHPKGGGQQGEGTPKRHQVTAPGLMHA